LAEQEGLHHVGPGERWWATGATGTGYTLV